MFKIFILLNTFLLIKFAITDDEREIPKGGVVKEDVNSKEIKTLASRAVDKMNQESNNTLMLIPVKVLNATSQRVAGVNFRLRILVGQSKCTKKQTKAKCKNCETETDPAARKVYKVWVFQQSWKNVEEITFEQEKMANTTGYSEELEALASRAVDKINQESNNTFLFFPVNVLCAKSSRVAGVTFELRILVGQSNCAKNQPKAKHTNCTTENDPAARKIYAVNVLQQSSKNSELIEFKQKKWKLGQNASARSHISSLCLPTERWHITCQN
ncbi:hypothetical protein niasHS_005452 [Heterodera schachtii]|uniref:Cystatin domain-containing protein n=1 Tax=Heterodera schachtii TaxID=97005 RepID=A0ABD2JIW7_HETSC